MKPTRSIKTADTLFRVLVKLQALEGAGVTELSNELKLAKSTVHNHLSTLESHGYVVKNGDTYDIGLRFLDHGTYARHQLGIHRATDIIENLSMETGDEVWFVVEEQGCAVCLYRCRSSRNVDIGDRIGKRIDIHTLAAGKAILSRLPEQRVNEIITQRGLEAHTERTVTDEDELLKELTEIRTQNLAITPEQRIKGVSSVAVPVVVDDHVEGAISIMAPAQRLLGTHLETIERALRLAANEIELRLQHM